MRKVNLFNPLKNHHRNNLLNFIFKTETFFSVKYRIKLCHACVHAWHKHNYAMLVLLVFMNIQVKYVLTYCQKYFNFCSLFLAIYDISYEKNSKQDSQTGSMLSFKGQNYPTLKY